jgi:hypothetical protein
MESHYGVVNGIDENGKSTTITITDGLVSSILSILRKQGKAENRFDINLAEGKQAESELLMLIGDSTIEVKRDFMASKTGNVAIEFMCGGKPSGISVTTADWWAFDLAGEQFEDEIIVLIKRRRLERLLEQLRTRIVRGGDNKKAEIYLVRVEELVKTMKGSS